MKELPARCKMGQTENRITVALRAMAEGFHILAERLGFPHYQRLAKILQMMLTPEEARLTAALPASVEELTSRWKLPSDEVRQMLASLFQRGILVDTPKGYSLQKKAIIPAG